MWRMELNLWYNKVCLDLIRMNFVWRIFLFENYVPLNNNIDVKKKMTKRIVWFLFFNGSEDFLEVDANKAFGCWVFDVVMPCLFKAMGMI